MHADSPRLERAIAAGKAGDRSALHYLYVRYADDVCPHLSDIVGRHGDSEDITQDVFLAMSRAIATFDPQDLPFDRWLLRLADDSIGTTLGLPSRPAQPERRQAARQPDPGWPEHRAPTVATSRECLAPSGGGPG